MNIGPLRRLLKKRETVLRVIDVGVLLDIEEHQNQTPEREIVGRIIVRDRVGVRYERFLNWSRNWDGFMVVDQDIDLDRGLDDNEFGILVHSHPEDPDRPNRCKVYPSSADMANASRRWLNRPYGIFHPTTGQLYIYILFRRRKSFSRLNYKIALGPKEFMEYTLAPYATKLLFPKYKELPPLDKSL